MRLILQEEQYEDKVAGEENSRMRINEKKNVTYLTYPSFEKIPDVVHGFSTREGGVSPGNFCIHEPELFQR